MEMIRSLIKYTLFSWNFTMDGLNVLYNVHEIFFEIEMTAFSYFDHHSIQLFLLVSIQFNWNCLFTKIPTNIYSNQHFIAWTSHLFAIMDFHNFEQSKKLGEFYYTIKSISGRFCACTWCFWISTVRSSSYFMLYLQLFMGEFTGNKKNSISIIRRKYIRVL